jgi:hypothetical protein
MQIVELGRYRFVDASAVAHYINTGLERRFREFEELVELFPVRDVCLFEDDIAWSRMGVSA